VREGRREGEKEGMEGRKKGREGRRTREKEEGQVSREKI
jgi:hypothetical protein